MLTYSENTSNQQYNKMILAIDKFFLCICSKLFMGNRWRWKFKVFSCFYQASEQTRGLRGLIFNGSWTEDPRMILAAYSHFADRFKETHHNWPFFRSQLFRKLEASDANYLESPFTLVEVKSAFGLALDLNFRGQMVLILIFWSCTRKLSNLNFFNV